MKIINIIFSAPLIFLIRVYKIALSPFLGRYCRFTPTCSDYALHAIKLQGPFRGSVLAFWRILRCSPWGGYGYDPAPTRFILKKYNATEHENED